MSQEEILQIVRDLGGEATWAQLRDRHRRGPHPSSLKFSASLRRVINSGRLERFESGGGPVRYRLPESRDGTKASAEL